MNEGRTLHVEAPGCIVNILVGITDPDGRSVTSVEVLADGERYAGEIPWWIEGVAGNASLGVRVIEAARADA